MPEISENNWPSCCPFIRYDVQNDIIEKRARQMIESSYRICLYYYITLLFNIGTIIAMAVTHYGMQVGFVQIIIASLYLVLWPIGDFAFRHMSLYHGFKNEDNKAFHHFFFATTTDVIFGIFLCTGWFFGGSGGLIAAVQNFIEDHYLGGGFSIVSTVLILGHILLHLKLCREVRIFYITRCKEDKRDKREEINDY
ncbi:scamp-domain-containing protein [Gigaspora margarita]|uniref:Scamp-domain-containing protein n=1 Tax=Gigaspora margarita TaxID=4874 RepID=A0A8H3X0N8_GIGMA|nr:scamp-domain-containing protein [Gigaspora margarita]